LYAIAKENMKKKAYSMKERHEAIYIGEENYNGVMLIYDYSSA